MKVGFYQFDVIAKDKEKNLAKVKAELQSKEYDLIVLPELFTSGYLFKNKDEVESFAEYIPDGETIQVLENITNENNCYIIGTIPEIENDIIYNTAIVVGPNGYMGKQRKLHLSKLEQQFFTPGNKIRTFDLNGTRIGIVTCFDSWYPEVARMLCSNGAQILCQPANFGGDMTLNIMRTRAIENLVYTITANRIGEEKSGDITATFRGESQIVDPRGNILAKTDNSENTTIIEIDAELAKQKDTEMCNFNDEWQKYSIKSDNTFSIG